MPVAVIMPKLEMSQETATVIDWIKAEGESVAKGEPLLTVETDKVTIEIESPASGILAGVRVGPDDVVPVTETIAFLLQPDEELAADLSQESGRSEGVGDRGEQREAVDQETIRSAPVRGRSATPVARRMAADLGVDLTTVSGTGPAGRITKSDVEAARRQQALGGRGDGGLEGKVRATPAARRVAHEQGTDLAALIGSGPRGRIQVADVLAQSDVLAGAPAGQHAASADVLVPVAGPGEDVEVVPLLGMRRTIAARMQQSYQTAPHITLTVEVDMSATQVLRRELNERAAALDVPRVSVTAILVKVCAWALQRHRWVNASLRGEDLRSAEIHLGKPSNVGVAVALEEGLIVPVIHHAEQLGIAGISQRLCDLTERARQGRLTPEDVRDGTFTISNLGMYGIDHFTAILNPPESAILAVGRIAKRSVVVECEEGDEVVIRPMMNMTLSADHRVLDGAVAARFLRDIVDLLEHPGYLLW
jgi:pyruvate dehydrogenase E2 component (dihydrolipoamide acetyltransferase)